MGDERLSDLTVLAVEREFEINLEEAVDIFSENHKNSRILLQQVYRVFFSFILAL